MFIEVFWFPLAAKLSLTAAIVVTASVIAERAGALTGALVATLPVTIWPAYVFLSLDHDASYIAQAALSGLAINAVTGLFLLVYAMLAQKRGLFVCIVISAGCWISLAVLAHSIEWSLVTASLLNFAVYPTCLWLSSAVRNTEMPQLRRAWYDLPMRTILVCILMATIVEASSWAGPALTGILAVYPVSTTSLVLILQPRVGGRAAVAVASNSLWSLFGISFSLAALSLSITPFGLVLSLAALLVIPVIWNLTVWVAYRRDSVTVT